MEMMPHSARSLAGLLEQSTGQQLANGRRWRIETVLQPVMREHGLGTLDMLAVQASRPDAALLRHQVVEALLNHETSFFRDYALFRMLGEEALPDLADAREKAGTRRLRVWSAGCSTGQEAYSLALLFAGDPVRWEGWAIDILGTDVSPRAIAQARDGLYSQFEVQRGLPIGDLIKRFDHAGSGWRIQRNFMPWPAFAVHNLLDPPPATFDVILCRNVLLYFSADRRRVVLDRLASALAPGGLLMLGAGETVLGQTEAFRPDRDLRGFYRPR